ncbi:DctP family TRAP transporter solute-binding subunit [Cloacibacillus porcorum]|uniref:TRAP transporter substrate-binding protein n=1 Tax=Cloacibacillus porcorum TaxID=1197717 RepID=UPI0023EFC8A9|nr:DctP family TRAP transporter solute-binding subunit [Cloacibacillus porcorum]MDD7650442.1 DctP family TRAP transporter solute-binding subunit [Cloacibacillus porcorum]MDY4094792.1 DctP family TRAP transporter solute-binding subunit [Cloacibacillus porcorum]
MLKKMEIVLIGSFLLLFFVNSCLAADKYIVKIASVVPETQSQHIALRDFFKKYVEEKSGGRMVVEIYPNGQLGGERQAIESVQLGTIHMTVTALAVLSGFEPRFQVFDLPFLFKDKPSAYKALDGELGDKLNQLLPSLGIINLAFAENGFRHITNNRAPIHKPAELKGLKIRTMENPIHMASFRALGANPTPMSFGELYTALQQKTVDAQENPIPLIYTTKFYEVQKYATLTGHVYAATTFLCNDTWFNNLPKDLQKIVKDGAVLFRDEQRKLTEAQDKEMLALLKQSGMQINELTQAEKDDFIKATAPVYEEFSKSVPGGKDFIELARKNSH